MKLLIIGGNRFVGLRLSLLLEALPGAELHILNRTGQAPHCRQATVYKGDRRNLSSTFIDKDWDFVFDFACFNRNEAQGAVDFFKSVKRYVFISTASVYDPGRDLKEESFAANTWDFNSPASDKGRSYQDGKRRAEAIFAQRAQFRVLSVRFPVILGPDDYTNRLLFHTERVLRGEPIFVPNPKAAISMIHAEDAARFLFWQLNQELSGPVNVACRAPITLSHFLGQIQLSTGRKPILATSEASNNLSPYGPSNDLFLNVDRLETAGFKARPILEWLPELIGLPMPNAPKGFVH